ncbi:MAG: hypothetical protein GF331_15330 [Chitinivibrionales bacterium]|nr:hypothetical protein [Chitinivibrionales bacterium]
MFARKPNPTSPTGLFLCAVLLAGAPLRAQPKLPMGINVNDISCWERSPTFIDPMMAMGDWHLKNADWSGGYSSGCPLDSLEVDSNGYPVEIPQTITGYQPQMVETILPAHHPAGRYVFTYDGEGTFRFFLGASVVSNEAGRAIVDYPGGGATVAFVIESTPRGNHMRNFRMVPVEMEHTYDHSQPFLQSYLDVVSNFHCLRFMGWQGINGSAHMYWSERRLPTCYTHMSSDGKHGGPALEYAILLCNLVQADMWWCMPHKADDDFMVKAARMIKEKLDPSLKWYCEYSNECWNWGPYFSQFGWINGNEGVGACEGAADSLGDAILQIWRSGGNHGDTYGYMANRLFGHVMSVFSGADAERVVRVVGGHVGWFGVSQASVEWVFDHGDGCDALAVAPYFGFEGGGSAVDYFCAHPSQTTPDAVVDSMGVAQEHGQTRIVEHGQYAQQKGIDLIYYEGGASYGYTDCLFDDPLDGVMKASAYSDGMYDLTVNDIAIAADPLVNCKLYVPLILFGEPHHYGHMDSASQIYLPREQIPAKMRALLDCNADRSVTAPVVPALSIATATPAAGPTTVLTVRSSHAAHHGARRGVSLYGLDGRLVYDPRAGAPRGRYEEMGATVLISVPRHQNRTVKRSNH